MTIPDITVFCCCLCRSFERYVQEIGRAGRDGLPAQCHTFLDGQVLLLKLAFAKASIESL